MNSGVSGRREQGLLLAREIVMIFLTLLPKTLASHWEEEGRTKNAVVYFASDDSRTGNGCHSAVSHDHAATMKAEQ